jgi:hypothetical protein
LALFRDDTAALAKAEALQAAIVSAEGEAKVQARREALNAAVPTVLVDASTTPTPTAPST